MTPPKKSALLPAQVELVELMQKIDFGIIEGLVIRGGLPVLKPRPRVVRDVKFGAGNGHRSEAGLTDFALKSNVQELMDTFASLGNATVRCLEVSTSDAASDTCLTPRGAANRGRGHSPLIQ